MLVCMYNNMGKSLPYLTKCISFSKFLCLTPDPNPQTSLNILVSCKHPFLSTDYLQKSFELNIT